MPAVATSHLQQQILLGEQGVSHITECVSRVDSARATAWDPRDEEKVKGLIESTVGFEHVDSHVTEVMVRWIGGVVKQKFQESIDKTRRTRAGRQLLALPPLLAMPVVPAAGRSTDSTDSTVFEI